MIGIRDVLAGDGRRIALGGLAFFAITSLAIAWSRLGGGLALVWPGSAILTVLLLSVERRSWVFALGVVFALSTIATSLFGFGPRAALPLAAINCFEGLVAARLMLAFRPARDWLDSVDGFVGLLVAAGLIAPALAALPGGLVATWMAGGSWSQHALNWIIGHGLGYLLVLPPLLLAMAFHRSDRSLDHAEQLSLRLAIHCAAVAAVAGLTFFQNELPILFLPIVPLLYTAYRHGRTGASLGLLIVAFLGIVSFQIEGSFFTTIPLPLAHEIQFLQFYVAMLLILSLPASIALQRHRRLLTELEERKALKSLIAEHSDDALLNLDAAGNMRYASAAGERLSGQEDLVGRSLAVFFDPLDEPLVRMTLVQAAEQLGRTFTLERAVVRDDDVIWLETKLRAIPPSGTGSAPITGYAVTIRDITARKRAELDALREAETDTLTRLPNRRAFLRHLEPRLDRAHIRPVALAILDLDHFKRVNDTHGHSAGDMVLKQVAGVMRRMAGPGVFFARLGGEEFALVAERRDLTGMVMLCEEVRAAIARLDLASADGQRIAITASVGVAQMSRAMTVAEALRNADTPLYAAKAAGRDRVETAPMRGTERRLMRDAYAA